MESRDHGEDFPRKGAKADAKGICGWAAAIAGLSAAAYNGRMDPLNVRAYLARDWGIFERHAAAHWAEIRATRGPAALLDIAEGLRMEIEPAGKAEREKEREADYSAHQRLHALLCQSRPGA